MKTPISIILAFTFFIGVCFYNIYLGSVDSIEIVQKLEVTQNLNGRGQWKIETWILSDGNCVYQYTDRNYPSTMYKLTRHSGKVTYTSDLERGYEWESVTELSWRN